MRYLFPIPPCVCVCVCACLLACVRACARVFYPCFNYTIIVNIIQVLKTEIVQSALGMPSGKQTRHR